MKTLNLLFLLTFLSAGNLYAQAAKENITVGNRLYRAFIDSIKANGDTIGIAMQLNQRHRNFHTELINTEIQQKIYSKNIVSAYWFDIVKADSGTIGCALLIYKTEKSGCNYYVDGCLKIGFFINKMPLCYYLYIKGDYIFLLTTNRYEKYPKTRVETLRQQFQNTINTFVH